MSQNPEFQPLSIGLIAMPQTSAATLYGLHEIFASVGTVWESITGQVTGAREIRPRILGATSRSINTPLGVSIKPDHSFADCGDIDIVLVPEIDLSDFDPADWARPVRFLRDQYEKGAVVCSVCTGSVLLADTGLLDGLEATTHWSAVEFFRAHYPKVKVRAERLLTISGDGHRIVTGGGASAWHDLALYLIARFSGQDEARRIAKLFLIGDHGDGQLPYAARALPTQHDDAVIARCQTWIANNYDSPNPVEAMIERSGLPSRTFARRFKRATGYTPIEYVQILRVEEAKQLLESTDDAVEDVADKVGYSDDRSFRRLFKRATGISPRRYRQRFRRVGWSA